MLCWLASEAICWWVCTPLKSVHSLCKCIQTTQLYESIYTEEAKGGFDTSALDCWCDYDWYAMVSAGLGTPLALLGCVGIPLLPCLLLLHQRGHLGSPGVKRRLAFLFCSYRSLPADLCLLYAVT